MRLSAVIGASYGDEGKGRTVDHLADARTLVVRFNGGAQAGHTVVTPDGRRHVFHHFGAGTFKGAATFLSQYFITNPLLFCQELPELPKPHVTVDPRCLVTTPWDIMLNQAVEAKRGSSRHGSCGVGINETVTRSEQGFGLTFKELRDEAALRASLDHILSSWFPKRAAELQVSLKDMPWAYEGGVLRRFLEDCATTYNYCSVERYQDLDAFDHIIFEGAQGLRLDEKGEDFPYVTRSRTGLTNIVALLHEHMLYEPIDVYYVTRPYLTRHGAGPLPNELSGPPYPGISDPTNQPNAHQGSLRYAWLDVDVLSSSIVLDQNKVTTRDDIIAYVAVTCLDQMPDTFNVVVDRKLRSVTGKELADIIVSRTQSYGSEILSYQPTGRPLEQEATADRVC